MDLIPVNMLMIMKISYEFYIDTKSLMTFVSIKIDSVKIYCLKYQALNNYWSSIIIKAQTHCNPKQFLNLTKIFMGCSIKKPQQSKAAINSDECQNQ